MQTNSVPSGAARPGSRRTARTAALAAAALTGAILLPTSAALLGASPAGASTINGTATIDNPGDAGALTSGGSATGFTVALPSGAACDGDTASDGYHVYSYLVKTGTSIPALTFETVPSSGYGFVDVSGAYYGAVNTAIGTGQIVGIPNDFEWAPLVTADNVPTSTLLYTPGKGKKGVATGAWDAGIACANSSGALTDYWNTTVTFTASSTDAHGFTWAAVPELNFTGSTTLPGATVGSAYSTTLTATGGVSPYSFKLAKGSKLPKGLKLNKTTGVISGTVSAKAKAGTTTLSVTVTDKEKKPATQTATATFSITVAS